MRLCLVDVPEVRYAKSGDVSIAYSVVGEGPVDLVFVPGFVSNVEYGWDELAQSNDAPGASITTS